MTKAMCWCDGPERGTLQVGCMDGTSSGCGRPWAHGENEIHGEHVQCEKGSRPRAELPAGRPDSGGLGEPGKEGKEGQRAG